jgi:uncharacterized NAD(P)/FAD-binding protein YdhS
VADVLAGGEIETVELDVVVNCTGPDTDLSRAGGPLVRSLLDGGLAAPDPLALGLHIDARSNLIRTDGAATSSLYAVGPPAKAARWEITAVPDIRVQISEVVEAVVDRTLR